MLIGPYMKVNDSSETWVFLEANDYVETLQLYLNIVFPVYIALSVPFVISIFKKLVVVKIHMPTLIFTATIMLMIGMVMCVYWCMQIQLNRMPISKIVWWL